MVFLTNQAQELSEPLNNRLTTQLQTATRIKFNRYSVDELVGILEPRVERGFDEGVVSIELLEVIASAASGDVRVAIETLRVAARRASQQGANRIHDEVIEESVSEAKSEIRQRNVGMLTNHQPVPYEIIAEEGEVVSSCTGRIETASTTQNPTEWYGTIWRSLSGTISSNQGGKSWANVREHKLNVPLYVIPVVYYVFCIVPPIFEVHILFGLV